MKLRVAVWVKTFPPKYESFIVEQIRGLVRKGHDVTIIAAKQTMGRTQLTNGDEALLRRVCYRPVISARRIQRGFRAAAIAAIRATKNPVDVARLFRSGSEPLQFPITRMLHEMQPFWKQQPFDIIHCQYGPLGALAAELKDRGVLAGEIVTSFRGYDLSRMIEQTPDTYSRLFQVGSRFLPVCEAFARRLEALGCPADRISILRSGIDVKQFNYRPRKLTAGQTVRIVSVGRLVEKKGIDLALHAVAALRLRLPRIEYVVVGDGPLMETLKTLTNELGISSLVTFRGWLTQQLVREELDLAHLMLCPSVTTKEGGQEGIPNTLKEAMACGLPVVATHHSGIPELVEDGVSGYLVPENDSDALSAAIEKLANEPERWREMGRAGREHLKRSYDAKVLGDQLVTAYERALG